jgi:tetratricopeptide (TPR) repeat protein
LTKGFAARHAGVAAANPLVDEPERPGGGPAQLPRDIVGFAGRRADLARLDAVAARVTAESTGTVICGIWGTAGVGKTTLAVHWAHRARAAFPDGQLYVDLRGFDPAGVPTDPAEAVRGFLDALGVPAQRLPATADARAALYRSLLADRRMLILLDNARDADQVRPLLPAAPRSLVLVTSRNRLAGLVATDGAQPLPLDLLTAGDARELLTLRVGAGRVAAEPAAADRLVDRAARLPLALAIVAARALTEVDRPLAALAAELRDDPAALGPLEPGDAASDLRRVFSWSYRTLSPPAARLFRLLGLHPGPRFSLPAAASLCGVPVEAVRPLLDELVGAHLVTPTAAGRYGLHDLLRAYAADLAGTEEAAADRRSALRRLLDHYLGTALSAAEQLMPSLRPVEAPTPAAGATVAEVSDPRAAMVWFTAERPTLTALVRLAGDAGLAEHVWMLASSLREFLDRKGWTDDQAAVQAAGLAAARQLGDLAAQANAHRNLVRVQVGAGRDDLAARHADEALRLFEALDEPVGQAMAHLSLGMLAQHQGDLPAALRHHRRALSLFSRVRHRAGRATALNNVAMNLVSLGEPAEALASAQEALTLVRGRGETWSEAAIRDSLAGVHLALGQPGAAVDHARRCLDLLRAVEDPFHTSLALRRLADAYAALGDEAAAGAALLEAARVLDELAQPDAAQGLARVTSLGHREGRDLDLDHELTERRSGTGTGEPGPTTD